LRFCNNVVFRYRQLTIFNAQIVCLRVTSLLTSCKVFSYRLEINGIFVVQPHRSYSDNKHAVFPGGNWMWVRIKGRSMIVLNAVTGSSDKPAVRHGATVGLSALVVAVMVIIMPVAKAVAQTATKAAAPASAAQAAAKSTAPTPEPVLIKLDRKKVSRVGSSETLITATTAKPGEVLEDRATYTNRSRANVSELEATLPVPPNTELVMSSVQPTNAKASIDGVSFSAMPLKRLVKNANGVSVEETVPLREYRFLRWYPGTLAAGQSQTYKARFKVIDDLPAPSASPNAKSTTGTQASAATTKK
jgi:hypothetical protein